MKKASLIPVLAVGAVLGFSAQAFAAEQVVNVTTNNSDDLTRMGLFVTPAVVKAGKVRIHLDNQSTSLPHEAIVVKLTPEQAQNPMALPYDDSIERVPEDQIMSAGEVAETEQGKSGDTVLDLQPGMYEVMCNIEGHYGAGMHALLTVK